MNRRTFERQLRRYLLVFACVLLLGGLSANAGTIVPGNVVVEIIGTDGTVTGSEEILIPIDEEGRFALEEQESNKGLWEATVSASGNIDPFTNLAFGVTNIAAVPVEFTFSVSVPIAAIPGATVHGGSTVGGVTDANFDGTGGLSTITSVPGTPYYAGQIDGTTVLSIYPDPTSFGFPFAFDGESIPIPALNPGLPGPTLPSGPALATIGIVHRFLLSPGDSMSATSFFVVEVPEPSSIVLGVLGGLGLLLLARRRRRK